MSVPFLDLHTHNFAQTTGTERIVNINLAGPGEFSSSGLFSCGIHPWYAQPEHVEVPLLLQQAARHPHARLIGECGLDKLRGPAMQTQLAVFESQVKLAEYVAKPVLVHCVRAFEEIQAVHKSLKPSVPFIIHGFNKKKELAAQLERRGMLLSLGAAVCTPGSGAAAYAASATGPFFLETDDSGIGIAQVYTAVANLRKISVEALKDCIFANWKLFNLIDA